MNKNGVKENRIFFKGKKIRIKIYTSDKYSECESTRIENEKWKKRIEIDG